MAAVINRLLDGQLCGMIVVVVEINMVAMTKREGAGEVRRSCCDHKRPKEEDPDGVHRDRTESGRSGARNRDRSRSRSRNREDVEEEDQKGNLKSTAPENKVKG